eukprot:Opistho-2@2966
MSSESTDDDHVRREVRVVPGTSLVRWVEQQKKSVERERRRTQQDRIAKVYESNRRHTSDNICHPRKFIVDTETAFPAGERQPHRKMAHYDDAVHGSQSATVIPMALEKQIPRYSMWVPIEKNLVVADETVLTHLPYVGDNNEEQAEFFNELRDQYEQMIDEIASAKVHEDVVEEIAKITAAFDSSPFCASRNAARDAKGRKGAPIVPTKSREDLLEALAAVYKSIPAAELAEMLQKSQKDSAPQAQVSFCANVDDAGPIVSVDNMMDSFNTLFCRRCYMYDCRHHEPLCILPPASPGQHRAKAAGTSKVACGPTCHLNSPGMVFPLPTPVVSSPRKSGPSSPKRGPRRHEGDWTCVEEAMFTKAIALLGGNSCAMAALLGTKTCAEVHARASTMVVDVAHSDDDSDNDDSEGGKGAAKGRKRKLGWQRSMRGPAADDVRDFVPCFHPDLPCHADYCTCMQTGHFCQKFCCCGPLCTRQFGGCRCKASCDTRACPCYVAQRECDPDVCTSCGASSIPTKCDEAHAHKTRTGDGQCSNVALQQGRRKHLLLAPSDVAGWGIFVKESVLRNHLISEYRGELVSQEEANRQGVVYDQYKCSFLFNLNSDYVVDATRKGNKIRFANHSVNPNCEARVMMVNGDYRIGIYAKKSIQAGDELFFDYSYKQTDIIKFVNIEQRRRGRERERDTGHLHARKKQRLGT